MKEIILVGADWCASCKAIKNWFFSIELPDVALKYLDVEEIAANVTSLPTFVFKKDDFIVHELEGVVSKTDLVKCAKLAFED